MGQQIIRQPNGLFAVFSDISGTVEMWDASRDEVEAHFVDEAAERARAMVRATLDRVGRGDTRSVYRRHAMTWSEALASDREHNGQAWREQTWGEQS